MTSGEKLGANGWARVDWRPWLAVLAIGAIVAFVNATSEIMEGHGDHWIEPVLWETTSVVAVVALAPLIGLALQRWPPRPDKLMRFGLIHLGLTIPFALTHILFIFLVRETAYWAVGARYGFFDEGVAITLLYEWRKDVLVYAAIAAIYWIFDHFVVDRSQTAPAPRGDDRIEVRDGGARLFLAPREISHVEAAGNYVEFHTVPKTYLVRGTLASLEAQLTTHGFVRVHRSRLVNRTHIAAINPTSSGDVEITLRDGRTLAGSRRFRAELLGRPLA